MSIHFCVLGSGSSGNATVIAAPHTHLLIDCGFSGDEMATRMAETGASWESLDAVLLTHTHQDHIRATAVRECLTHGVTLFCHESHVTQLDSRRHFRKLVAAGLVKTYDPQTPFKLPGGAQACAFPVPHDCPRTFGFLVEFPGEHGHARRIGYLADLGHWTPVLTEALAGVDLLAIEFNHDEEMERNSRRHADLIERVLGPLGHLSNRQAAEAVEALRGHGKAPKQIVLLHLSRECNLPRLAYDAALEALGKGASVFVTKQDQRGSVLEV
jgi:phosphoribosyl 1,2-cyclic phosphodiesterase